MKNITNKNITLYSISIDNLIIKKILKNQQFNPYGYENPQAIFLKLKCVIRKVF
jgi:hypothetical protein